MISKKELLEKIKEVTSTVTYNTLIGQNTVLNKYIDSEGIDELTNWINSLPDDQPDLLPFEWPVPEGMEVVTRDGRKVEQLVMMDGITDPLLGVIDGVLHRWNKSGSMGNIHVGNDLFLRRKDRKVWVVEWPDGYMEYYPTMDHADHRIWSRNLPESTDRKHGGEPKKYEATLKPVV